MQDHEWRARRSGAVADLPRTRARGPRGAPISAAADPRDTEPHADGHGRVAATTGAGADNGAPASSGEPILDADAGAATLPPGAHVRVGLREPESTAPTAATAEKIGADLLPHEQELLADL